MAAIILPGQPGAVDDIDVTQQGFREQIAAIAFAAKRFAGGTNKGVSTTSLYVDPEIGSDLWAGGIADPSTSPPLTNQQITAGYSKQAPFKTLQRALIEAARLSIVTGVDNDKYDRVVIRVSPGEHIIDNAPPTTETVTSWGLNKDPDDADLRAFNTGGIGVILPRGVSIIGEDLRKSVIRATTVPAASLDPSNDRGTVFKATGGSFFFNFTFKDSNGVDRSHHLLSAFEFCPQSELDAFYEKVATAFDLNPSDVEIRPGEVEISAPFPDGNAQSTVDTTFASSAYVFNCSLRSDYGMCGMFLDGSKVTGFKSMVVAQFTNVSLQKDMNAWQLYSNGTWAIPASYQEYIDSDINDVRYRIGGAINHETGCYQTDYRSFGFKCINNAILQEVSCFVIGDAIHHWTASGGECTITNSNSNFGMTALLSSGFRGIGSSSGAFNQDKGFVCTSVRRPLLVKTDGSNIRQFTIGTVDSYDEVTGTITLQVAFDQSAVLGQSYSLKQGDYIWIENKSRETGPGFVPGDKDASSAIDARAQLAATPWDEGSPSLILVNPSSDPAVNNITTIDPVILQGNRVYIRRLIDTRAPEDRGFNVSVMSTNGPESRRPVGNFIVRLGSRASVADQIDPSNGSNQLFLISDSVTTGATGSYEYRLTLRPGDGLTSFEPGRYYRVGTPIFNSGRVYKAKRNKVYTSFAADEWEPSFLMLPSERGIESSRAAIAPEIIFDKDISNSPSSTTLGINQLTDADVLNQIRSSTDFRGVSGLMQAIGYSPNDIGSASDVTLSGKILAPQASEATRDWDPAALSSPAPSGKLSGRQNWPLEFNRPSLVRAFGQAYEWAGQGNYSKAMPKYQFSVLSDQHKIDYFAVSLMGGRVYNTGFNEDGLIVQGNTITDLGTNTVVDVEVAGLGALSGDPDFPSVPTSFDNFTVTGQFNSLGGASFNNITINGDVSGTPTWLPDVLPVASDSVQGIIEIATKAETLALEAIDKAITPANIADLRGEVDGLASLDGSGTVPLTEIPNIPSSKLTAASTTETGVVELATDAETLAFADTVRAVTPDGLGSVRSVANGLASLDGSALVPLTEIPSIPAAKLPTATDTALGLVELATDAEALAASSDAVVLTPGNVGATKAVANGLASLDGSALVPLTQIPSLPAAKLPAASDSATGIVELATNAETLAFADSSRAVTPAGLGSVRAAANGLASLDGSSLVPLAQIPVLTAGKLPVASETATGIVELATDAEAAALASDAVVLTPGNLGAVRGAANGLASLDGSALLPTSQLPSIPVAKLPSATTTTLGVVELATDAEALALSSDAVVLTPGNLGAVRGVANGVASLDGSTLLPTTQLPEIPLAKIPVLDNTKIPVLNLDRIPTLPANKLLTTPVAWVAGNTNFDLSGNFTFTYSSGLYLAFGAPTTTGYVGTSGFIYVTNATADKVVGVNSGAETNWIPITNTWVDPTDNTTGLGGNLLIGYYIAAANTVIYTASKVG